MRLIYYICYILYNVMTQDDDVTLINNAGLITGNDNDGQFESAVSCVGHLSNVSTDVNST